MLTRENSDGLHDWDKRRTLPQDAQKGHPLHTSFVKRRSSLVAELAAHVHEIRFTRHGCRERY
jgi:hypothetical protein